MFLYFKDPLNSKEGDSSPKASQCDTRREIIEDTDNIVFCPRCKKSIDKRELEKQLAVCVYCGHHHRLRARQRLNLFCDKDSFVEMDEEMASVNLLGFPEYDKKIETAQQNSKEKEAVICGLCTICGVVTAIFVMEPYFMMGSMGVVVGEKITRLFEYACKEGLPVVGFTVSGGARMQEGIFSIMQMAKINGAVKYHNDDGHLYVCVLTDPTTGGVSASFAMSADIIIAEPFACVGKQYKGNCPLDFKKPSFF